MMTWTVFAIEDGGLADPFVEPHANARRQILSTQHGLNSFKHQVEENSSSHYNATVIGQSKMWMIDVVHELDLMCTEAI